ncbi:unnamed protein product [Rotaria sp. Silwood2]|nr:unnamed protein product [Rotaria sp. Silwood2]CAF3073390.1 unnamed protein product [Rotaria sp. Silwood2]CAF3396316.1 unnamed protein product [Rotaria sp. Silwood2]CAF4213357.1 unnamed protein product [Rotaria sp. Silwood2]CAF4335384.1 unnamed protein product [Rotaria sp. Silwood2]
MSSSTRSIATQTIDLELETQTIETIKSTIIDVEDDDSKRLQNRTIFSQSFIHLPDIYYTRMVQVGMLEPFMKLIMNVNHEQDEKKKKINETLQEYRQIYKKRKMESSITILDNKDTDQLDLCSI